MTNAEKFEEVFKIKIDENYPICDCIDHEICAEHYCSDCPVFNFWNREYKEEIKEKEACETYKPKPPCDDTISRLAALVAISKIGLCKCSTNEVQAVDECLRAVEVLPPDTAEQKTGHWIPYMNYVFPNESTKECSECKYEEKLSINRNYCPNCGIKMEKIDRISVSVGITDG